MSTVVFLHVSQMTICLTCGTGHAGAPAGHFTGPQPPHGWQAWYPGSREGCATAATEHRPLTPWTESDPQRTGERADRTRELADNDRWEDCDDVRTSRHRRPRRPARPRSSSDWTRWCHEPTLASYSIPH